MEQKKEYVYCQDCLTWVDINSQTFNNISVGYNEQTNAYDYSAKWAKFTCFTEEDGACIYCIDVERDHPTRPINILGNLISLNANNDCPHYKPKPEKPVVGNHSFKPVKKLPWWKIWRSKGD